MRLFVAIALAVLTTNTVLAGPLNDARVRRFAKRADLNAITGIEEGTLACAVDTRSCYIRKSSLWEPLDASSPEYTIVFDEGASKGLATIQLDGTVADTATGVWNMATYKHRKLAYAALGAGQTIDLAAAAGGLDISGDASNDEGYEVVGGWLGASGRPFIVGTDPAFKFCATVALGDVSDTDDFHVGFRRAEINRANFDDYVDLASIGINASAATAAIKLETILANAATTSTDTTDTWADNATKELCVYVGSTGAVTYSINGSAPTVTASFTFGDGTPVIPFIWALHSSSSSMGAVVSKWEVAYQ